MIKLSPNLVRASLLGVIAAGLLSACSQEPAEAPPPPTAEPAPATPAVVGPVQLTFTGAGVGEIGPGTPLDRARIQGLFPGAEVKVETFEGEMAFDIITVRREDGLALDIFPGLEAGQVGQVFGRGGPVVGAGGEQLGAAWAEAGFDPATCVRGQDQLAGQLICYRAGEPQLGYMFDLPGYEGPDSEIPDAEFLTRAAKLSGFMWTAAAS